MPPIEELSHGYEKPTNPTYGSEFFPALERNIERMNSHSHNGEDGERIGSTLQTVSDAGWGSDLGGGTYRQLVTCPTGISFDTIRIEVRRDGEVVYPTIEREDATHFYLYTNDSSAEYVISYV